MCQVGNLRLPEPPPTRCIDVAAGDGHGRWDGRRVQQLLRNLVSNALQHGDAVANRGPAIDPAERGPLFDPLRRGTPKAHVDGIRGLGLGLYIVREITKAHGGEVEVQCAEGETAFIVHLPRAPAA